MPATTTPRSITRVLAALLRVRWLVRFPVWLYRARLGFLFGNRLLMVEHIGRRSGLRRYVVLEVVDHPQPDRWVVVSGFGDRAQWYRNIRNNPGVRVSVAGRGPTPATAGLLAGPAAATALTRYAVAHPHAWARLRPVLEQTLEARIDETGSGLPLIALDVHHGSRSDRR